MIRGMSRGLWSQKNLSTLYEIILLPIGCLVWGIPALVPTDCCWGQILVRKYNLQQGSQQCTLLRTATNNVFDPAVHQDFPPSQQVTPPPNTIRQSCPVSHDVTAFYPESQWTQDLWNSCDQTSLTFKARFSEGSSSHCQTPRLVSLTWGLEHLLLWENFWGIIIF